MPDGKKCAFCLSIDFDALSSWIWTANRPSPATVSRGEFAVVGADRLLELLDRHRIKSTWFIPGHTADTYPEKISEIYSKGHEIAHHNYLHENPYELSYEQERSILLKGMNSLREVTGENPMGFRAPDGDLSFDTVSLLVELGFLYDSSMSANDYKPYRCREGDRFIEDGVYHFGDESELLEIPFSWDLDDWPMFEFMEARYSPRFYPGLRSPSDVFEVWFGNFDFMYGNVSNGVYVLTLHPSVIGRGHRILMLDKLVTKILSFKDVWPTTMTEIAKAWKDD